MPVCGCVTLLGLHDSQLVRRRPCSTGGSSRTGYAGGASVCLPDGLLDFSICAQGD